MYIKKYIYKYIVVYYCYNKIKFYYYKNNKNNTITTFINILLYVICVVIIKFYCYYLDVMYMYNDKKIFNSINAIKKYIAKIENEKLKLSKSFNENDANTNNPIIENELLELDEKLKSLKMSLD